MQLPGVLLQGRNARRQIGHQDLPPTPGFRFLHRRARLWCVRSSGFPFSSQGSFPPIDLARRCRHGILCLWFAMRRGGDWLTGIPCWGHTVQIKLKSPKPSPQMSHRNLLFCVHGPCRPCPIATDLTPTKSENLRLEDIYVCVCGNKLLEV